MNSALGRTLTLAGAAVIVFGVTVAIGMKLVPPPRTESDYLVIGSVATFLSLIVLFAVLLTTWLKAPEVFFKKRPKRPAGEE
ncbi:MAG: hypothetical protein HY821_25575 [Acidobacteria bacterium]|nr:hypothetical protein [Acidobacteriota bacterium]